MANRNEAVDEEIEELERMARQRPTSAGGGGGIGLNDPFRVDGKEGVAVGTLFVEGKYAFRVIDLEMKLSKGGINDQNQQAKEQIPYLELTLQCFASYESENDEFVGEQITDRLMAKGKGVTRFKIFAKAVGLWDDDRDEFNGRPIDFMECEVWGTVKTEKSSFKGQDRERSIIDFAGYEPINKYPLPDDELFEATGPDHPAQPVAVETEPDDVEEPEDEDLEPLQEEPAPKPRARAAGQAGSTAPWKK